MIVYADTTQLAEWLATDQPPDNATTLLRSASLVVAKACNRDPYLDTPTDLEVAPLADATCAQAATWIALGVNPAAVGTDVRVAKGSKIGTGSVEFDTLTPQQVSDAATMLAPEAEAILQSAGLLWQSLPAGAPADDRLERFGLDDPRLLPPIWVRQ